MTDNSMREPIPTCREVVELITDYLDGRMSADDRERFERHLAICTGCVTYLQQMRAAIATAAAPATEDVIPEQQRNELIDAFRELFR